MNTNSPVDRSRVAAHRNAAPLVRLAPSPVAASVVEPGGHLWRPSSIHGSARPRACVWSLRDIGDRDGPRTRVARQPERSGQAS